MHTCTPTIWCTLWYLLAVLRSHKHGVEQVAAFEYMQLSFCWLVRILSTCLLVSAATIASSCPMDAGDWWQQNLLCQADYERLYSMHAEQLQAAAVVWSGGLGPWALDKKDAAILHHLSGVRVLALAPESDHMH